MAPIRYYYYIPHIVFGYFIYDHFRREKVRVRVIDSSSTLGSRLRIVPLRWSMGATIYSTECSRSVVDNSENFIQQNSNKLTYLASKGQFPIFEYKKPYSLFYKIIKPPDNVR